MDDETPEETPTGAGVGNYGEQPNGTPGGGLNEQGYGAAFLPLSPVRTPPPPSMDEPFSQADKIRMAKLQAGMAQVAQQEGDGTMHAFHANQARQRIQAMLRPLMQKQQKTQKQQQQQMMQQMMEQVAMQESMQGQHGKLRAQNFPQTVGSFTNPTNGRQSHFAPKMTQHGSHWDPIDQGQNDQEGGQGVEDFQTLLERAQQQIPQPPGQPMMRFHGRLVQNRAWLQWHSQTNQLAQKWQQNQTREQQQGSAADRKAQLEEAKAQKQHERDQQKHQWDMEKHQADMDAKAADKKMAAEKHDADMKQKAEDKESGEFAKHYHEGYVAHEFRHEMQPDPTDPTKTKMVDKPNDLNTRHDLALEYVRRMRAARKTLADEEAKEAPKGTGDGGEMGKAHENYKPAEAPDKDAVDKGLE